MSASGPSARPLDVAVIGAGVSGLAAGLALARRGRRVAVFEAAGKVGGCCATTRIDGYTFHDGAMYVAMPRLLDSAFRELGLDRAAAVPLRKIALTQEVTLADGTVVRFGEGRDVRVLGADARQRSQALSGEIDALMDKWQPVLRLFADEILVQPFSASLLLRKVWRHLPKFHGTLAAELRSAFADPAARAAMAGSLLYTGLPARSAPVAQVLGLVAMLDEGLFIPEGGMGAIPEALAAALRASGGEIATAAPVDAIGVSHGRVTGVRAQGLHYAASAVISTMSGMHTLAALEPGAAPASMKRRARTAPLSHRAFSVQLGLANRIDAPAHMVSRLPLMDDQDRMYSAQGTVPEWICYAVPTVTLPGLAPPNASIVEMYAPIDPARVPDSWGEAARRETAEGAIAALRRLHSFDIAVARLRSPREFRDEMHLHEGAVYGLSPAAGPLQQFPRRTPIANLFQAGQTSYPGFGVAPSILSGIFAAQALA